MVKIWEACSHLLSCLLAIHQFAESHSAVLQRKIIEVYKNLIQEGIAKNFDPRAYVEHTCLICIADVGYFTGPNTFVAIQIIIDAIKLQFQAQGLISQISKLLVFFNDQVSNDFNTLFKNLPRNRKYIAYGALAPFDGRLFPRKSLYLVHSSSSLHWLSTVPKEITDRTSGAWNKGRIDVTNALKEVEVAYATQYKMDLEAFLHAIAQELIDNRLMDLQIPVTLDLIGDSDLDPYKGFELLGSCLVDMMKVVRNLLASIMS